MNEDSLTHTPMKNDGMTGHRKTWMTSLIIILAVITVAGITYSVYAWQQNQKLSADITTKNNQISDLQKQAAAPAKTIPPTSTQTTPPVPTATYLDIKEMGIKLKLSDDIKDAEYSYSASGPTAPIAYFSTTSLVSKSSWCAPTNTPPFGSISETTSLGGRAVNNTTVFQVGSKYFIYTSPQSPCTQNSTDQAAEISRLASFKQALTTMQADQ